MERRARSKIFSETKRLDAVSADVLSKVRRDNERYREQHEKVLERVHFAPRDKYILKPSEPSDVQYFRIISQDRENLVEGAKILDITVADNLGMPDLSPTRKKEIQKTLIGLDIVNRVVEFAIESRVREVRSINLVPETGRRKKGFVEEQRVRFKITGSAGSIAAFMEKLQSQDEFLAVDSAVLKCLDGGGKEIEADITVSALTVVKEEM